MPYLDPERQSKQGLKGLINLVEKISPTIFEVGRWLLGGLIALNFAVIGALDTVGAVDKSIVISATADFTIK